MQQVLHDLPLTLAYIGADLVAIALLVGAIAFSCFRSRLLAGCSLDVTTRRTGVSEGVNSASPSPGLGVERRQRPALPVAKARE